jgi:hypothetical protein
MRGPAGRHERDPGISLGEVLKPGGRHPADKRRELGQALARNGRTCRPDAKGAGQAGHPRKALSIDVEHRGRTVRSRVEGAVVALHAVMALDRRDHSYVANATGQGSPVLQAKIWQEVYRSDREIS